MQMIYGSLHPNNTPETEKQNVIRMMAALETYPWEAGNVRGLVNGAFGIHGSATIPSRNGLTITADARLDNREELISEFRIQN